MGPWSQVTEGLGVRLGSAPQELCDLSLKRPPEKMGVGGESTATLEGRGESSVGPLAGLPAAQVTRGL